MTEFLYVPEELSTGRAEPASGGGDSEYAGVRAILWLPDPEARHWWREFYVREPKPPKPGGKVGFLGL